MSGYRAEFLRLAAAHFLAMASPGPDFAIVLKQSLAFGRRTGIYTAIGVGCALSMHVGYSLFGLGLLLRRAPLMFVAVKWAGAAYLAWMGIQALRAHPAMDPTPTVEENFAATAPLVPAGSAWRTGFLTNALNPKVTLFFVAFFATLVSPTTPSSVRLLYGGWVCTFTALWFMAVATLFTHAPVRKAFLRCGPWIDRSLGVVFIAFAILLAGAQLK